VLSADNKLAIFFTTNGILMGQLSQIKGVAMIREADLLYY
jgi:hypothetical protein